MKKLFGFILVALLSANSYVNSVSYNNIEHAIENSNADFINKNLSKIRALSKSDKISLASYAQGIKKLREKDLKLDKIKPLTDSSGILAVYALIAAGYGTFWLSILGYDLLLGGIRKDTYQTVPLAIGSFTASTLLYILHKGIGNSSQRNFRNRTQIYLDAINIQKLIETII